VVDRPTANDSGAAGFPERSAQTLPVPLGGLAPVHRHSTALRRTLRRHRSPPLLALAVLAAGSGVWLSIGPRSFNVGEEGGTLHVDDLTLTPLAQYVTETRVFTGPASVVIDTTSSGVTRGGAVMTWNGAPTTGRCVLLTDAAGASETCEYDIGARRLTSTDSFDARTKTWYRRYGDGVEIAITVSSGKPLIPIPFPLGR
jgi:hypothetical protein